MKNAGEDTSTKVGPDFHDRFSSSGCNTDFEISVDIIQLSTQIVGIAAFDSSTSVHLEVLTIRRRLCLSQFYVDYCDSRKINIAAIFFVNF